MIILMVLTMFSCVNYGSFNSPVSSSSRDSEGIADVVSQLFSEENSFTRDSIRFHALRLIENDNGSPLRDYDNRQGSFSLDNEEDRNYAHNVAIRASEMVMSDLQERADRKMSKKKTAIISAATSVTSSVIVLLITLFSKE